MAIDPLTSLRAAWTESTYSAEDMAAAIKSAVRDALPGRQQKKNLDPIMAKAIKAAVRTLRRRAR